MGGLLSYSLSVSVIILLLYPVLQQIINRSRYFRFNRIALLVGLLLSLTLPCVYNGSLLSLPSESAAVNLDFIVNVDSTLSKTPATDITMASNCSYSISFGHSRFILPGNHLILSSV